MSDTNTPDTQAAEPPMRFNALQEREAKSELLNPLEGAKFEDLPSLLRGITEITDKLFERFQTEKDPDKKRDLQILHLKILRIVLLLNSEMSDASRYTNDGKKLTVLTPNQDPMLADVKYEVNIQQFENLKDLFDKAITLLYSSPNIEIKSSTEKALFRDRLPEDMLADWQAQRETPSEDTDVTEVVAQPDVSENLEQVIPAEVTTEIETPVPSLTELEAQDATEKQAEGEEGPVTLGEVINEIRTTIESFEEPLKGLISEILKTYLSEDKRNSITEGLVTREDFLKEMQLLRSDIDSIKEAIEKSSCLGILNRAKQGAVKRFNDTYETLSKIPGKIKDRLPDIDWESISAKTKDILKKLAIGGSIAGVSAGVVLLATTNPALLLNILGLAAKGATLAGYFGVAGTAGAATFVGTNNAYNYLRRNLSRQLSAASIDKMDREEYSTEGNYDSLISAVRITRGYDGGYNEFKANSKDYEKVKELLTDYVQANYEDDLNLIPNMPGSIGMLTDLSDVIDQLIIILFSHYRGQNLKERFANSLDPQMKATYALFTKILDDDANKKQLLKKLVSEEQKQQKFRYKAPMESFTGLKDAYNETFIAGNPISKKLLQARSSVGGGFMNRLFKRFFRMK